MVRRLHGAGHPLSILTSEQGLKSVAWHSQSGSYEEGRERTHCRLDTASRGFFNRPMIRFFISTVALLVVASSVRAVDYFPPPASEGGWRVLEFVSASVKD